MLRLMGKEMFAYQSIVSNQTLAATDLQTSKA